MSWRAGPTTSATAVLPRRPQRVLADLRAAVTTPTPARIRGTAMVAVVAAVAWYMTFRQTAAPLWAGAGDRYAAVHLLGVAVLTYAGLVTWARRPASLIGPLLVLAAFANHIAALQFFPEQRVFVADWSVVDVANWLGGLPTVIFLHASLTFPSGRITGRFTRGVVIALYGLIIGLGWLLPTPLYRLVTMPGLVVAGVIVLMLAVRYHRASPAARRVLGPVPLVVAVISCGALLYAATEGLEDRSPAAMRTAQYVLVMSNPLVGLAFTASLLRTRLAWAGVGDLVVRLQDRPGAQGLVDALRQAVRDPTLDVGFWLPERASYVTSAGARLSEDRIAGDRAVTPVVDADGGPLAVLIHDVALAEEDELLHAVEAATHFALENARLQAELQLRLREVQASRARLVHAADAERRRVERDLHDGAQQRLVTSSLLLQQARARARDDATLSAALDDVAEQLAEGLRELRELARGIHPVVLTDNGLAEALTALAGRAPLPVVVTAPPDRFAPDVELTAYFVVAEGLTNVVKHADATCAVVVVSRQPGGLELEIADDGVGGAAIDGGTGLQGLQDRLGALGGTLTLGPSPGGGTLLRAAIPLERPAEN
jgi:signal transduction histidine kinase